MIKRISEKFTPKQYIFKFFAILTALFGLYLLVAWSSYSPLDNTWASSTYLTTSINKAGALGAWLIDLIFVLFGYVGHIFPFMTLILPLVMLRRSADWTWSRRKLALRIGGFLLFLCGACVLFTLLFAHNAYYLSGGVLGGSLVTAFFPWLDFVGLMLSGFIFALVGFFMCSGSSLIQWLVNAYYWLTMQNPSASQTANTNDITPEPYETEASLDDLVTPESLNQTPTPPLNTQVIAPAQESQGQAEDTKTEHSPESALSTPNIHISTDVSVENGEENRSSISHTPLAVDYDDVNAVNLGGYVAGEEITLPKVSMQSPPENPIAMEQQANLATTVSLQPEQAHVAWQPTQLENADGQHIMPSATGEKHPPLDHEPPAMPSISLSPLSHLQETENASSQEGESDLAQQFMAQEQQRLAEMTARAKAINAEEALQHIFADPAEPDVENASVTTPNYKSYAESLIHPALQQKVTVKSKPTTPMPSLSLLEHRPSQAHHITEEELRETSRRIEHQLRNFNVKATVKDVLVGPVVTRYELELQPGVKASRVTGIDTDLARALMFRSIRVAEVIPGKPYIGIETPNDHRQMVTLREVLDSDAFRQSTSLLSIALGKDISGQPVVVDLAKMPHLLVAGSTGSGKSVGVNTMILSLLFRVKPEEVKFIMIDPKVVELSIYDGIPHLLTEVVTDMKKAANALRWCVDEMERRYQLLSALRVRNIEGYNEKIVEYEALNMPIPNPLWRPGDTMDSLPPALEKLSYIVVIVDEFADLMMVAGKQVEELIARLAQKARATGIHLILATQRPSVDVITGLIKANIPSRIAFTVASKIDSRTILDQVGAEALLGRGDMLYSGAGSSDLVRVHGAFMSDDEVARVVDDWKARGKPHYIEGIQEGHGEDDNNENGRPSDAGELDDLFDHVSEFVISTGSTSISLIQRKFKVGFNRAARIMEQLEEQGIVSAMQNGKREVLVRHSSDF
ncbi:DNA translocase FtsK [Pasteurella sp. PK-2025]|uniref:DNA translocase FtsK n=1 Tax=Pasteurella sp. PK-2025 TaxID=3413133 RepID=UPI003C750935